MGLRAEQIRRSAGERRLLRFEGGVRVINNHHHEIPIATGTITLTMTINSISISPRVGL